MGKKRYRKISVCIWNDAKFLALSHQAKLVLFFMLTHQELTQLGALRATVPGLACELGMELDAFTQAFEEVLQQGIVEYDKNLLFWFPNFLKHNLPESPNVVKSWHYGYCQLPESPLRTVILLGVRELVATMTKGFQEAFTTTFAEEMAGALPNQRTDNREQRTEAGKKSVETAHVPERCTVSGSTGFGSGVGSTGADLIGSDLRGSGSIVSGVAASGVTEFGGTVCGAESIPEAGMQDSPSLPSVDSPAVTSALKLPPCPYGEIQNAYNRICTKLPKCREITAQRKSRLKSLWNAGLDRKNLAWWERYFSLVHQSAFLAGENDRGWTANFDWVVAPANMVKIQEGLYLPKPRAAKGTSRSAEISATNRAVYDSMMQRG